MCIYIYIYIYIYTWQRGILELTTALSDRPALRDRSVAGHLRRGGPSINLRWISYTNAYIISV